MILIAVCLFAVTAAISNEKPFYEDENAAELFENFIQTYKKVYEGQEKLKRFEIFKENLHKINYLNSIDGAEFGINHFTDLTREEMKRFMGYNKSEKEAISFACDVLTDVNITTREAPPTLDYRKKNMVTAIKNQMQCGSCWIFASIGSIEGSYASRYNKLKSFSEQQLLDCLKCSKDCETGGDMIEALSELITTNKGVMLESDYPYTENKDKCQYDESKTVTKIKACYNFHLTDEDKLKEALFIAGPIAIGVNGYGVQTYNKGIMTRSHCDAEPENHAVLLIGYGTENGTDYWLIKNSWGTVFGEDGYMRITRNENTCGLMNESAVSAWVE